MFIQGAKLKLCQKEKQNKLLTLYFCVSYYQQFFQKSFDDSQNTSEGSGPKDSMQLRKNISHKRVKEKMLLRKRFPRKGKGQQIKIKELPFLKANRNLS
jgi:hypothetical protein